jgi:hypothetical protein
MQAPWSTRQCLALQVGMTAGQPEIAKTVPAPLGLVDSLSGLMSTALDQGAGGIRGVQLLGMVTLVLGALGRLVCVLVPVEILPPCAAPASRLGEILALVLAARNRCAGSK